MARLTIRSSAMHNALRLPIEVSRSRAERVAAGRALRKKVPRKDHSIPPLIFHEGLRQKASYREQVERIFKRYRESRRSPQRPLLCSGRF